MHAARLQTLWQASVLFAEKLDVEEYLRSGAIQTATSARLTMSDSLREQVELQIGRMNGVKHDGGTS